MADRFLLVVEGPDDKHVIWAILEQHKFEPHFTVKDEGGYEILHQRLSPRLKPGSDLERFGIVVDADSDINARWQSIKDVLNRAGYAGIPDPAGTVVDHDILVEKFGGTRKGWVKKKGWDSSGQEWHWYEHNGIGRVGAKRPGEVDPF